MTKPSETQSTEACEPIRDPVLPEVKQAIWPQTSVDRFILSSLEKAELKPSGRGDRRTLIRRVTYDLTGLPPTAEQVDVYLADTRSGFGGLQSRRTAIGLAAIWRALGKTLAGYCALRRHGRRKQRPSPPHAWKYRNWVIRAMNRDQPYDEFLRDQIAGDLFTQEMSRVKKSRIGSWRRDIWRSQGGSVTTSTRICTSPTRIRSTRWEIGPRPESRLLSLSRSQVRSGDSEGLLRVVRDLREYAVCVSGYEPKQQPRHLVPLAMTDEAEEQAKAIDGQIALVDEEILQRKAEDAAAAQEIKIALARGSEILSEGEISEGGTADLSERRESRLGKAKCEAGRGAAPLDSSH